MGRGSAKGSSPKKKSSGRKASATRRSAQKRAAKGVRRSPATSAKAETAQLARQLTEAQARQAATSEILRIISQSSGNVQPVFDAIVLAAVRLLGCDRAHFLRCDARSFFPVAVAGPEGLLEATTTVAVPIDPDANLPSRAILALKDMYLPDWSKIDLPAFERSTRNLRGTNSSLLLPMLREGQCIGVLALASKRVNDFDDSDIALAKSFRDKALIAFENARQFNETREALAQQTATADILRVIASSPANVQPVFDAIAESARRLLGSYTAVLTRVIDDVVHLAASTAENEATAHAAQGLLPYPLSSDRIHARVARTGQLAFNADAPNSNLPQEIKEFARTVGWRSMLAVPMLRNGIAIGTIGITRREAGPFDDKTINLLKTFADQAVIAIENARLFNETKEALERQTATSDILRIISQSPADVKPVFDAIVLTAVRLLRCDMAFFLRCEGNEYKQAAQAHVEGLVWSLDRPQPIDPEANFASRAIVGKKMLHVPDFSQAELPARDRHISETYDIRSALFVPLLREEECIGLLVTSSRRANAFDEHAIALAESFRDQALIAIENTRLFNETQEALQSQIATADILKVIARSPSDVKPVFDQILNSIERLIESDERVIVLVGDDGLVRLGAAHSPHREAVNKLFPRPLAGSAAEVVIRERRLLAFADVATDPAAPSSLKAIAPWSGARSFMMAPLLSENRAIGAITITRQTVDPFNEKERALLSTFADQAVIAIENTRLFNETQEALARQTATSDVLRVISSSVADTTPVFEEILDSCEKLFATEQLGIFLVQGDGQVHPAAWRGAAFEAVIRTLPSPLEQSATGIVIRNRGVLHFPNIAQAKDMPRTVEHLRDQIGDASMAWAPMLGEEQGVGSIAVMRQPPNPFSDKELALLKTFADQAVIAIQNTRLFNETREALEQQTATSEVLEVISSSPGELDPVFQKMLENACRVCEANFGIMQLWDGESFMSPAAYNVPPALASLRMNIPLRPHPLSGLYAAVQTRNVVHLRDVREGEAYRAGVPNVIEMANLGGARTIVIVPMLKDDQFIGAMTIYRQEVRPFTDKQIALVENFTKQAVIAIENTRLLRELRERTNDLSESLQQQTATSEVLRVISSSSGDLQPVFKAMLGNALNICEAAFGNLLMFDGIGFEATELHTAPAAYRDLFAGGRLIPEPATALGRIVATKQVVHIPDIQAEHSGVKQSALRAATIEILRARTLLAVPMLKDDELVGTIVIYRQEVRPFNSKQIELVKNFADQAVIAIENARLLNELRVRTQELTQSLDDLRAAQDRLVQTEKLASLGQLTAGIAHEIKNPLNFVNNFSALSAELTDELNDTLKAATLTDRMRDEVRDLTRLLKENLEKVVQHGKRADSIVKNMLLHSREGSGEQRSADVNALVDESLNLAYHGARAEKSGFNITLQRDFDAAAGTAELFPQEITRALLNLISNGFYAATKRKNENGQAEFEPTLLATTKSLGSSVEIRIRDNGAGILPEVKEKMFNPFFTTKPAGEGTGLGLSMTHDIVVKQHGGRIDVETEPGSFTEFVIVLPRAGSLRKAK